MGTQWNLMLTNQSCYQKRRNNEKKENQFYKIIVSLKIYDYIIITFFVALFALVFIRNYQFKDAKLPCIFELQTEKLEQMQEGEPVRIQGELAAYEDQLQYEHLEPGTYTYVLTLEAVDYASSI